MTAVQQPNRPPTLFSPCVTLPWFQVASVNWSMPQQLSGMQKMGRKELLALSTI
jgi:hypothetical protein